MEEVSSRRIAESLQSIAAYLEHQADQLLFDNFQFGLSQYRILTELQRHDGQSQKDIAATLGQTEASISRQVRILQDKGLALTRINPENRREKFLLLSKHGQQSSAAAAVLLERHYDQQLAMLDDDDAAELSALLRTLQAILL